MAATTQNRDECVSITTQVISSMTDIKRHIFPFFELPAELRNFIYDASITDVHAIPAISDDYSSIGRRVSSTRSNVKMTAINVAPSTLLLVSRQFGHELSARIPRKQTMLLTCANNSNNVFARPFVIPAPLRSASHIIINTQINLADDPFAFRTFFRNMAALLEVLDSEQKVTVHWIVERPRDGMARKTFWVSLLTSGSRTFTRALAESTRCT